MHAFPWDTKHDRFKWHLPAARTHLFPFLPPRWLHNEVNKPKAGLSPQLSVAKFQRACMHACTHAHARPHSRLRDSNKGALARRCNLMDEHTHNGTAGQQVACWTGTTLPWDARSRMISSFSRSQTYHLSRKKRYFFPSPTYLLLTKFLKIVWLFVSKKRQCGREPSRVALDAIERISLKIEIIVYL